MLYGFLPQSPTVRQVLKENITFIIAIGSNHYQHFLVLVNTYLYFGKEGSCVRLSISCSPLFCVQLSTSVLLLEPYIIRGSIWIKQFPP